MLFLIAPINFITISNMSLIRSRPHSVGNKLEEIDKFLDTLSWYDRELFKLYYYEGNTLDKLATKTRISRNSLFSTIDKVRRLLKKEFNNE
jgi:DNA-directed RNA polymerase specialized sigma24 family protein